jgi:hypothetical protein
MMNWVMHIVKYVIEDQKLDAPFGVYPPQLDLSASSNLIYELANQPVVQSLTYKMISRIFLGVLG